MALSPFALGADLAMCQCCSRMIAEKTEMMEMWRRREVQVKESRCEEEIPQRWNQPKGEDRTEMKKEEKRLRCTLLNGLARSTERKYTRR